VSVYAPVKPIALLGQFNVLGLPAEAGAGRLELILIRERSFTAPRSWTDITTFGEEEEFRAPNSRWAVAQALATYYTV